MSWRVSLLSIINIYLIIKKHHNNELEKSNHYFHDCISMAISMIASPWQSP